MPEPETPEPVTPEVDPETPDDAPEIRSLRDEAARRRVEARTATDRAEALGRRLMTATVERAAGGILEDVTDLPDGAYTDEEGYPDEAAITAAAEALIEAKPHLAKRRFANIDAGAQDAPPAPSTIMAALRQ